MAYTVYILQSKSRGTYYVGQTRNLEERIKLHNAGQVSSTRGGVPWVLMHSEEYPRRSEAITREREIKRRKKRSFIESLIHTERGAAR